MGPVLVATMVQEGLGEPQVKKVHPFFTKGPSTDLPATVTMDISEADATAHAITPNTNLQLEDPHSDAGNIMEGKKRRQPNQPRTDRSTASKKPKRKQGDADAADSTLATDPECSADNSITTRIEDTPADFPTPPLSDISVKPPEQTLSTPSEMLPSADPSTPTTIPKISPKPKKVLKFNTRTGTLGSPPKTKQKASPSRVVTIRYGRDEASRKELGGKISQILAGSLKIPSPATRTKNAKATPKSKEAKSTPKSTHPFFTGKLAKKGSSATLKDDASATVQKPSAPRQTVFMSTPVSPKKSRLQFSAEKLQNMPRFGAKPAGIKVPGAVHPLWPPQGMSHVRGDENLTVRRNDDALEQMTSRKSKGCIVTVSPNESVMSRFGDQMNISHVRDNLPTDPDAFEPAPKQLRIPQCHFESGPKLFQRIRPQLRTIKLRKVISDDNEDQGEFFGIKEARVHPAVDRVCRTLSTTLSAYDRSTCESQAWTQKYAPTTASQVLQAGREAPMLKEWLEALKIQAVDTSAEGSSSKDKSRPESAPRKRRKKNKLDDFIVDSDEEANEMDEISENEDDWAPAGTGRAKKTVIRSGDMAAKDSKEPKRLTNVAIISGPHGCGKTAAVYAVANELGFEIFEINPGSRRSGKDILEKVGDMTRNHLVQQNGTGQGVEQGAEDEVARDLKSGKQGMMTAFFQPKSSAAPKPTTPNDAGKAMNDKKPTATKSQPSNNQKQSLILLEEVDILYEEDKQFWATLMGMIAQSKRPFIMTCNDESLVPLQSLSLHGIFRFSPPPTDLAVDLCLLIAANEGHALQRPAVQSLYASRGNDLRATLTELNFWCQIGVGDRRGGFDWFYPRWPKGSDLDENGDVVRVISEGTYLHGMGWIGRDLIASSKDPLAAEEEALHQSWDSWGLDMGDWSKSQDLYSWTKTKALPSSRQERRGTIASYDAFCESMSDADISSCHAFAAGLNTTLDATLPDMPTKMGDDFIIGRKLLEADPWVPYSCPHPSISTSLKSLSKQELYRSSLAPTSSEIRTVLAPVTETKAISTLDRHFASNPDQMTRLDLAFAFDPIAISEKAQMSSSLEPSVFDRTMKVIVLDVAPWVRGIVEFDHRLMHERLKLSNLLSEGGKRKRMRNTRSAYSALEGGERRTTRRERYFGDCLNTEFVRQTCGQGWQDAVLELMKSAPQEDLESVSNSPSPKESSVL